MQDAEDHGDWLAVLDEEVSRLPEKYRVLVVLCELEGLSRKAVAQRLGIAEGTISSRLSRARGLLRDRLTRRGLALPAGALAAALPADASAAAVRPALANATVHAALQFATGGAVPWSVANLAEGALKAMFIARLQVGTVALLIVAALASAAAMASSRAQVDRRSPAVDAAAPLPPPNRLPARNRFATAAMSTRSLESLLRRGATASFIPRGASSRRTASRLPAPRSRSGGTPSLAPAGITTRSRKPGPESSPPPGLTAPSRPAFPNP